MNGTVLVAHCTCMAGTGETCSHVGACLFAAETAVRIRNSVSCTQKENIWLPAYVEKVQFKRLRDINFTSSRGRKEQIDGTRAEGQQKRRRLEIPGPSPEELNALYDDIGKDGAVPALFSVLDDRCDVFQEPVKKPASHLRNLFTDDALGDSYDVLVNKARELMSTLTISEGTVKEVESLTKQQSDSPHWFSYRAGRITVSLMKKACHTKAANPSVSLIKEICYPEAQTMKVPAIMWGRNHEKDALAAYANSEGTKHDNFKLSKSGLHLSTRYPFSGATPDALVSCSCCRKGVAEFKNAHTCLGMQLHSLMKTRA
ncbi:uncharacterized protein LOC144104345 [Amblyomma americanum]